MRESKSHFIVALTGGIASGKTAASDRFRELGVEVFDADIIARELTAPGSQTMAKIATVFGKDLIDDAGKLKRKQLRRLIFSDPNAKSDLERILHPEIFEQLKERASHAVGAYCIVVIPLLAETGRPDFIDRVLLVDSDTQSQIRRLTQRDGVSLVEAQQSLNAQANRKARLEIADDVLANDSSLEALREKVDAMHQEYCRLAKTHHLNESTT